MPFDNSLNATSAGIQTLSSVGVWTGSPVTRYALLIGDAANAVASVSPSSTSGIPVISQGVSLNPTFGTAVVAGGGTGAVTLTGILTGNGTSAITANAVTQYGTLIGGAANAVASLGVATNGQIVIGSTGTTPVLATITEGAGISITNGAGSITIAVSGEGLTWSETSGVFTAVTANGYSLIGASTATLPASPSTGTTIVFQCNTASAVVITAAGTQIIRIGGSASSAGGTVTNTAIGNALTLTYSATNTVWIARGVQGNWTIA